MARERVRSTLTANWLTDGDAKVSSASRYMRDDQLEMPLGEDRVKALVEPMDPKDVDWICCLGWRIVGQQTDGVRFDLR